MREADARLGREVNQTVDRSDILEYLAFSTYKQGIVKRYLRPIWSQLSLPDVKWSIVGGHPVRLVFNSRKYSAGARFDKQIVGNISNAP